MSAVLPAGPDGGSVFVRASHGEWLRWRERKLRTQPRSAAELVVEVRDPRRLSPLECQALEARCRRAHMAVYASRIAQDDPAIPLAVGRSLGARTVLAPPLADAHGVARIAFDAALARAGFIAYSAARMLWHTDGNDAPPERSVASTVTHCVRAAAQGGQTRLFDPEMAWLLLREADPRFVDGLTAPDALAIAERRADGRLASPLQPGAVFSTDPASGRLRARLSAGRRRAAWKCDATVAEAAARLRLILDRSPAGLAIRLEPGMGLVCNNVFRARTMFSDDAGSPRLLLHARFAEPFG